MLSDHCPRHGARVLIPASGIRGIEHTDHAFLVRWRCTCGSEGTTSFPRRRRLD